MAVMANCRVVAESPVEVMTLITDFLIRLINSVLVIIAVNPAGFSRSFATV
jgi:hypothetical protein